MTAITQPAPLAAGTLRFYPLGGLGEVGRNMTVFEHAGKLMIVDCGVLFPEDHHPGVDLILPDFEPIRDRLTALASNMSDDEELPRSAWPIYGSLIASMRHIIVIVDDVASSREAREATSGNQKA